MTPEFPLIYVCSHAGKIGNIRWFNSDTRWPDWIHKRWMTFNPSGSSDTSPPSLGPINFFSHD